MPAPMIARQLTAASVVGRVTARTGHRCHRNGPHVSTVLLGGDARGETAKHQQRESIAAGAKATQRSGASDVCS